MCMRDMYSSTYVPWCSSTYSSRVNMFVPVTNCSINSMSGHAAGAAEFAGFPFYFWKPPLVICEFYSCPESPPSAERGRWPQSFERNDDDEQRGRTPRPAEQSEWAPSFAEQSEAARAHPLSCPPPRGALLVVSISKQGSLRRRGWKKVEGGNWVLAHRVLSRTTKMVACTRRPLHLAHLTVRIMRVSVYPAPSGQVLIPFDVLAFFFVMWNQSQQHQQRTLGLLCRTHFAESWTSLLPVYRNKPLLSLLHSVSKQIQRVS